jgi:SanA protein
MFGSCVRARLAHCSDEVPLKYSRKTRIREWLARVKAWLDVYVLGTAPKFYGLPVEIKIIASTSGK